ncbi:MAG: hypothetical protein WA063_02655 [Minisyncoccia bacterium]
MVMPLFLAIFLMLEALETASMMVFFIYAATVLYYAIVLIKVNNGTILSPKKNALSFWDV